MTQEIFTPENKSIDEMFSENIFYEMPIYQRPYAWDKDRVEQLWFDILEAYKNHQEDSEIDQNYFLGSIVVVKKDKKTYEVVDGQQRLTTLTILFCVLRDLVEDKEIELTEELQRTISECLLSTRNNREKLTLTTHLNNQAEFKTTVLNRIDFSLDRDKNKFLSTAFYFRDLIIKSKSKNETEFYIEDLSDFIDYLFNNTTMIRIVCGDENFAIKLFSVLNDRGMDLSPTDIIKAHLMQGLNDEKDREAFAASWREIEGKYKNNDNFKELLTLYLYYNTAQNPKRSLQEELKKVFVQYKGDSLDIISKLKEFQENLIQIEESKDKKTYLLKYIPYTIYWKAILATAKNIGYSEFNELKGLITKYYYQTWISGGTSSRVKQTSFNIIREVKKKTPINDVRAKDGNSIKGIKTILMENLQDYSNYKNFLYDRNTYKKNWHKAILVALEYELHDDSFGYIEINKELHTEHILPEEWNSGELNWKDEFTLEDANELLNSLGNLTLLSGRKNIQASNRNYRDKISIYSGDKNGEGITSYQITKDILKNNPEKWDKDSITRRRNEMIDTITLLFDIK